MDQKTPRLKSSQLYERKNEIDNPNYYDSSYMFQSQNRMDDMELADHNETFNKVLDYDNLKHNVLNKKVCNLIINGLRKEES